MSYIQKKKKIKKKRKQFKGISYLIIRRLKIYIDYYKQKILK